MTRRIAVSAKVRPKLMQPDDEPRMNYIVAARTGTPSGSDESLDNSMNIQSPDVTSSPDLCLEHPSQITAGRRVEGIRAGST